MDQLSVHKERTVRPYYSSLDIMPIFNVSYSPEFNPIESCFSQVKRHYCAERLNVLANFGVFDQNKTIRNAFKKVTPALVISCVARSLSKLRLRDLEQKA